MISASEETVEHPTTEINVNTATQIFEITSRKYISIVLLISLFQWSLLYNTLLIVFVTSTPSLSL